MTLQVFSALSAIVAVLVFTRAIVTERTKLRFSIEPIEWSTDPDDWNERRLGIKVTVTNKGKRPITLMSWSCQFQYRTMMDIKTRTGYHEAKVRLEYEAAETILIELPMEPWTVGPTGTGISEITVLQAVYVTDSQDHRWNASRREMRTLRRSASDIWPVSN